jgi:hypothetical protein
MALLLLLAGALPAAANPPLALVSGLVSLEVGSVIWSQPKSVAKSDDEVATSRTPADRDATAPARQLLDYLGNLSSAPQLRLVFGHQEDTISGEAWVDESGQLGRSDTLAAVGDRPGLIGFNGFALTNTPAVLANGIAAARALPRGSIIALHFPADNPVTNGTHKDHSGKPIVALLPGGHGNAQWRRWLDVVATFCNGVSPRPVLFRPFHENLGPWNWWGSNASSPAQYRAAWNYTLAYLLGSKGVHNVLSVYSPDKPSDYFADWRDLLERYPGDDLVDVVAFDHYDTSDGNYSASLVQCCRMVAQLAASRSKVAAIAEFGFKHGSENISGANAGWFADEFLAPIAADALASRVAYAMTWTNRADSSYWVPEKEQAAFAGFKRFFDSKLTLFSRDLPSSVVKNVVKNIVKTDDSVQSDDYDCLMRRLALSYTQDVVLGARSGWRLGAHRDRARSLVAHGLRIEQCNNGSAAANDEPAATAEPGPPRRGPAGVALFVATTGSDSAAGTAEHPLASIKGAQAKIRALYPTVSARPSIRVNIMPGNYFFGAAGPDHLSRSTQYSNTSMARFGAEDSGASPSKPIVYAAADLGAAAPPASFIGGLPLKSLAWGPAGAGFPRSAFKATVPGSVRFDVQDQLFLDRLPLVRARTPNGRPWIPLDGFNLSTIGLGGTLGGPPTYRQCTGHREAAPAPPPPGNVTGNCSAINHGVCLHNAMPILEQFSTVDPAECCGNCTALGSCVSWNVNVKMKQCFLRGSYKPNSGAECISGCVRGACAPPPPPPPRPPPPPTAGTCTVGRVVCNASNTQQVMGVLGVSTASGRALASHEGVVAVEHCLQHALGLANDFPVWSAQSYGLLAPCDAPNCDAAGTNCSSCANAMYEEYNHPRWFGPWAKGIKFDPKQDTGAKAAASFKFEDAAQVVVHAMAVGEWGGVQYRVASAAPSAGGRTDLLFSHGGYQQARGAAFRKGPSRYYLEGDRQFLDVAGEWHFNPATRELFIIAPDEFGAATAARLNAAEVLLTQTDALFEFVGAASDSGSRVENVVLANLTFSHTSADFFRPHEETSGGDYTTHRSGAIKVENATGLVFESNNFSWIGGNAVVLSASVRDVNVTASVFRFLGTSGVAVQGKTGDAMMDGRDGELMVAVHGPAADNGVRLPTRNLVSHNIFADYGIWDKQSACYHKALAPGNMFKNNVCFNSSRHGVNFQDGFGGGGIAEGNVMFNLNRETSDTTAFNSWNRRNYITSSPDDPAVGVFIPAKLNEWRRNLILNRNYFGVRDSNGDGLRNDDGASNFLHSNNVLYQASITFNGGTQIHLKSNLLISSDREAHWNLGPTPDVGSAFNNTFVGDSMFGCKSGGPCDGCRFFWQTRKKGQLPGVYTGDGNVQIFGSSDADGARWGICGKNLSAWRKHGQDAHSMSINGTAAGYTPERVAALAKAMLYAGQERGQRKGIVVKH